MVIKRYMNIKKVKNTQKYAKDNSKQISWEEEQVLKIFMHLDN